MTFIVYPGSGTEKIAVGASHLMYLLIPATVPVPWYGTGTVVYCTCRSGREPMVLLVSY